MLANSWVGQNSRSLELEFLVLVNDGVFALKIEVCKNLKIEV